MNTHFSITFEIQGNSEIGLKLSISQLLGFFIKGITLAILRAEGKIPEMNDWFIMIAIGPDTTLEIRFKSLTEIPSTPLLVFGLNALITLRTSSEVTRLNEKEVNICVVRYSEKCLLLRLIFLARVCPLLQK